MVYIYVRVHHDSEVKLMQYEETEPLNTVFRNRNDNSEFKFIPF